MSDAGPAAARRAERLLRCYPAGWRERYGEEFAELLMDDIGERPRSWVRTADVVRSGTLARLAATGLAGQTLEPERQLRAGLAWLGAATTAFLALGVAIWSELTIGWQWSPPATPATRVAMLLMSAAILIFAILALLAAIPIAWSLGTAVARGRERRLLPPLALAMAAAAAFTLGSIHFGHGWPGTGGHQWVERGLVPGDVARFCWAATLWVTSYWAHPGALSSFPATEIGWMVVSPLTFAAMAVGATMILRRTPLSPRVLRYESRLGAAAVLAMAVFLAGAGSWVISGGPAPRGLFRVGAIDSVGVVALAAELMLAVRALQRALPAAARHRP
jgi:hypothetical protein